VSVHRIAKAAWFILRALMASSMALAVAARAQPYETAPEPAAPRPLTIAAPTEQRLPNGLRVVLAARPGVRLVTAQLVVLSGSEADPPKRAGLASVAAGLLTKGTQQRSASAQAREAESLGGALESSAGWHQSQVSITVTVPQLDQALALLADAAIHPSFAPAELSRLRAQAIDSLKVTYSQPATLAALEADRRLFGTRPYGHATEGTPASLRRITRADLTALHHAFYRPDNAVLVLAGDIDDATALRFAIRHFGAWKAGREPLPASPASWAGVPATLQTATVVAIDMPKADQAAVVFALPLPPLGADRAIAAVMNAVLGGDFSSRLNQQIRIQRGLSYGVGSRLDARPLGGALRIGVQTRGASAAEVVALVQTELDRLMAEPVPEAELAARKAALIGTFGRSLETTAGLADALRSLVVAGLPVGELRSRADKLAAVTADQVQEFAAGHLAAGRRRVVVAGALADFGAALSAQAALVVLKQDMRNPQRGTGLTSD
jgi:zinc protease